MYRTQRWRDLRLRVLRRDQYRCQMCGAECYGKKRGSLRPIVDHIKQVKTHPELAWDIDNLRVLCAPCDNRRHAEKGMMPKDHFVPVDETGAPFGGEWE